MEVISWDVFKFSNANQWKFSVIFSPACTIKECTSALSSYLLLKPWGIGPGHLLAWRARGKVLRRAAFHKNSCRNRWAQCFLTQDKYPQSDIGTQTKISISRWSGSFPKAQSAEDRETRFPSFDIGTRKPHYVYASPNEEELVLSKENKQVKAEKNNDKPTWSFQEITITWTINSTNWG